MVLGEIKEHKAAMASGPAAPEAKGFTQLEDVTLRKTASRISDLQWQRRGSTTTNVDPSEVMNGAKDATEQERQMGLLKAMKTYRKAIGWSIVASTALVMEGYDVVIIFNFFGLPSFAKKYGVLTSDGSYQVTAAWQSGLANGGICGEMLGLLLSGILADRYGYRKTIIGALLLVICFIFITFFAQSAEVLLVGEILCGIPWGCFQTITTAYAAEVTPLQLRPYLTSYINLCWVMGQILGSGVIRAILNRTDEWGYRIPFALQWLWPIPLIIGMTCAPESPWWLVRKGRLEDAVHSVNRLTSPEHDSNFDSQKVVAMMIHTNEMEKELTTGTSYLDCFKGVDLRRTEICCMVWMIQVLCGGGLMSYSAYFFERAGLDTANAFDLTMAQYGLGAIGVSIAWTLMPWFGRRILYLAGNIVLCVILFIVGFISIPTQSSSTSWATGAMLLVFAFVYDSTVGPLCYSLVAEMSSTRLRQKTIVLARNAYLISYIITNVLIPRMLNPTAWNWRGKAGFFWAGSCLLSIVWIYFRLPEPKGRTYAELDILFHNKVPARKFAATTTTLFRGNTLKGEQSCGFDTASEQTSVTEEDSTRDT